MKKRTLVSIIIPCYNGAKFVGNAIKSGLNQIRNLIDIEILVVNDGSTDKSAEVVQKLAKDYKEITLINQHNQGSSAARNTGIRNASGDYILFLDADDFISPNCLENFCVAANESQADILMFDTRFASVSDYFAITPPEFNIFYELNPVRYLQKTKAYAMDGAVWRVIFNRNFILDNNLLFNTDIKFSEDNLFMMAALTHCRKLIKTDTICHHYVLHGENMTMTIKPSDWKIKVEIDISRATEIMKLYQSDRTLIESKELCNVYTFSAYQYVFEAIKTVIKARTNITEIATIMNQLKLANAYPMAKLSLYPEYREAHMPILRLQWALFKRPLAVKTIARIFSLSKKLKVRCE